MLNKLDKLHRSYFGPGGAPWWWTIIVILIGPMPWSYVRKNWRNPPPPFTPRYTRHRHVSGYNYGKDLRDE